MSLRELVTWDVAAHVAQEPLEAAARRRILALLTWLREPFDPSDDPTHVTGSAIVFSADGLLLLHRHKRLGRWLQPGGHLEPGEAPGDAALRETVEETGLAAVHPSVGPCLVHLDVHEGPRGHVHLDLRYLLTADRAQAFAPAPGESEAVAWVPPSEARTLGDRSLDAAVRAAERRRGGTR